MSLVTNRHENLGDQISNALAKGTQAWIATAYISPAGCERLQLRARASDASIHLVVGRALAEGVPYSTLDYLRTLDDLLEKNGGGIRAAEPPCHSKLYYVEHDSDFEGWIGSSNLTDNGLEDWVEANLHLVGTSALAIRNEVQHLWEEGKALDHVKPTRFSPGPSRVRQDVRFARVRLPAEPNTSDSPGICLSLLGSDGEVQRKSGLNWWNAAPRTQGKPRPRDEACVALPSRSLDLAKEVFQTADGEFEKGTPFLAKLHDGTEMRMKLQGTQKDDLPKQISSYGSTSIFGEWILRKILNLPKGQLCKKKDLEEYGRTDICFYRIGSDPDTGEAIVQVDFRP